MQRVWWFCSHHFSACATWNRMFPSLPSMGTYSVGIRPSPKSTDCRTNRAAAPSARETHRPPECARATRRCLAGWRGCRGASTPGPCAESRGSCRRVTPLVPPDEHLQVLVVLLALECHHARVVTNIRAGVLQQQPHGDVLEAAPARQPLGPAANFKKRADWTRARTAVQPLPPARFRPPMTIRQPIVVGRFLVALHQTVLDQDV